MKSSIPLVTVAAGICLVVLGLVWPMIFPAKNNWTDEKANRMTELQNNAHKLFFLAEKAKTSPKAGGPTPTEAQSAYEKADAELKVLLKEFEGARDSPQTVGTYVRWAGIAIVLLGGAAVMVSGNSG